MVPRQSSLHPTLAPPNPTGMRSVCRESDRGLGSSAGTESSSPSTITHIGSYTHAEGQGLMHPGGHSLPGWRQKINRFWPVAHTFSSTGNHQLAHLLHTAPRANPTAVFFSKMEALSPAFLGHPLQGTRAGSRSAEPVCTPSVCFPVPPYIVC